MRFSKLSILAVSALLLLFALPAFAQVDSFTDITTPMQLVGGVPYGGGFAGGPPAGCGPPACATTDFGGGDGSGGVITSLGDKFTFSTGLAEFAVPSSWATWNVPPAVESGTPNVLFTQGQSFLHIDLTGPQATVGFELEPDQFQAEIVDVVFNYGASHNTHTIALQPNGSGGALLFATTDTSGAHITSIDITDESGDDFAIAQLRAGAKGGGGTTPEPGTMILLGSGLLGALGVMRRKMNL